MEGNLKSLENSGWSGMQELLDKEMPVRRRRRFFFWWWFAGAAAIVAGVYFLWPENPTHSGSEPLIVQDDQIELNHSETGADLANGNEATKSVDEKTSVDANRDVVSSQKSSELDAVKSSENPVSENQNTHAVSSVTQNEERSVLDNTNRALAEDSSSGAVEIDQVNSEVAVAPEKTSKDGRIEYASVPLLAGKADYHLAQNHGIQLQSRELSYPSARAVLLGFEAGYNLYPGASQQSLGFAALGAVHLGSKTQLSFGVGWKHFYEEINLQSEDFETLNAPEMDESSLEDIDYPVMVEVSGAVVASSLKAIDLDSKTANFNSLYVPLTLDYSLAARWFAHVGTELHYLMNVSLDGEGVNIVDASATHGFQNVNLSNDLLPSGKVSRFGYSLRAGVGYRISPSAQFIMHYSYSNMFTINEIQSYMFSGSNGILDDQKTSLLKGHGISAGFRMLF